MLNKEWLLLSADMTLICLRIAPGLAHPITEAQVLSLLLASNCRRYQPLSEGIRQAIGLLNALLANPDARPHPPVPIAQRHDACVLVVIEQDAMSATAQLTADWGGKWLTQAQLQDAVVASGIKQGLSDSLLAAAILASKEAAPGAQLRHVIALGRPVEHGLDTRLERLVETPAERILKPQELDHGRVDMRDLGALITVKAGAPLMRRHPATRGIDGFTVTGQALPARAGKESQMTVGEGSCVSAADPDLLLASRNGLPCHEKSGMRVDEVLSVKQVDARHGHVSFEGSLLVTGDVMPGMRVQASGDVVIGGFVENGTVVSGGSITVRNGIIGRKQEDNDEYPCQLSAGGEIHASYAQYARLEADGDIHIQSQLSHCYCRSGQDLRVGDSAMRKGHLIGGISIANRLVMAPVIGASAAKPDPAADPRRLLQPQGAGADPAPAQASLRGAIAQAAGSHPQAAAVAEGEAQSRDGAEDQDAAHPPARRGQVAERAVGGDPGTAATADGRHEHSRDPAPVSRGRGGDGPPSQQGRHRARPHQLRHPRRTAATDPLSGPQVRGAPPPARSMGRMA
ncbi:flagellar assembly protein A [Aeromonas encheleia]|uniref:flagellar assembly protein A n=1 Tax=Aeromonas encheleia TaxID=73010 RepID=UPI003BF5DE78